MSLHPVTEFAITVDNHAGHISRYCPQHWRCQDAVVHSKDASNSSQYAVLHGVQRDFSPTGRPVDTAVGRSRYVARDYYHWRMHGSTNSVTDS